MPIREKESNITETAIIKRRCITWSWATISSIIQSAFTEYRKEILNVAIPVFIICVIVLTVLLLSVSLYKKLRAAKKRIADIKEMSLKIRERREKEKSI